MTLRAERTMERIRAFVEDFGSVDCEPEGRASASAFVCRKCGPDARKEAGGWYPPRDLYGLDAA